MGVMRGERMRNGFIGAYDMRDGQIWMNTNNEFWDDLEKQQRQAFDEGWFSSEDPNHVVYHEIAHKLHHDKVGDRDFMYSPLMTLREDAIIAEEVSFYGATESAEMVAEVFAGVIAGKTFSKEVMDIYEKYGGPDLPTKAQAKKFRFIVRKAVEQRIPRKVRIHV